VTNRHAFISPSGTLSDYLMIRSDVSQIYIERSVAPHYAKRKSVLAHGAMSQQSYHSRASAGAFT
jgi:hypothetical protein